jgi:Chromo (CHRromatin Organisation MOdifier) domain
VRARTSDQAVGDWAYVKILIALRELSKRHIFPAVGPPVVTKVGMDRRTFKVKTSDGEVTISADQILKCSIPADLPDGLRFATLVLEEEASHSENEGEDLSEMGEHIIYHLLSHRRDEQGAMQKKVKWFGYDSSSDTWEPILHLLRESVQRYVKWRKLKPSDFGPRLFRDPDTVERFSF